MSRNHRILVVQFAVTLCLGPLLAMLGPFGTFVIAPAAERMIYWTGLMIISFALYRPAYGAAVRAGGRQAAAMAVLATVLATLPMTLVVWLASFRHAPALWPSLAQYADLYPRVLLIAALVVIGFWAVQRLMAQPQASEPAPPAFLDRLPPSLRGELLALQMEDHYLRVHTDKGSALILMRMRDAVAELDAAEGAQVHRSWWVATRAVASIAREGRNLRLMLSNGVIVPVARERTGAAKAARLIPRRGSLAPGRSEG